MLVRTTVKNTQFFIQQEENYSVLLSTCSHVLRKQIAPTTLKRGAWCLLSQGRSIQSSEPTILPSAAASQARVRLQRGRWERSISNTKDSQEHQECQSIGFHSLPPRHLLLHSACVQLCGVPNPSLQSLITLACFDFFQSKILTLQSPPEFFTLYYAALRSVAVAQECCACMQLCNPLLGLYYCHAASCL